MYQTLELSEVWIKLMDGFLRPRKDSTGSNLDPKPGYTDIRRQSASMNPIGDAIYEEDLLQERVISFTINPAEVVLIYFNNDFSNDPPSCAYLENRDSFMGVDAQESESIFIEDIVRQVHMPSEEFAEVVTLESGRKIFKRFWNWLKKRIGLK
ncbi:uncharacterized protein LOC132697422 isoform X2 [Cylas formicarius]|uniref:uncharacterized protein LOC132697422 isoform X2 n=1 Tax=Cylas formicarius TaxID=197179 RepID=UPI0029585B2E|nr:uncharacterized protein LOC132697422 isoform X2 [Cylas formicarius]